MKQKIPFLRNFNWRLLLVRILINAIALLVVTVLLPNLKFVDPRPGNLLVLAIALGILNAVVKPILQVLTFQFVFATYGLLVVVINTLMLYLLAFMFSDRYAVGTLLGALVGGALLGLIAAALEAVLGTTIPIVPESEKELRNRLEGKTSSIYQYIDKVSSAEEAKKAEQKLQQPQTSDNSVAQSTQTKPAVASNLPEAGDAAPGPASPGTGSEAAVVALEEPSIVTAEREDASQPAP